MAASQNLQQIPIPAAGRPYSGPDVLYYYDGPLLFWLPSPGRNLLALALPEEVGAWPFLVSELTDEQARALLEGALTLRSAVVLARENWLLADYGSERFWTLSPMEDVPEDWLPGDLPLGLVTGQQGEQS